MSAVPGDWAERRVIEENLDETVIVEAAAGTGKTTELVQRVLNVLASGRARIDQIVAVTFTEKAAGELKLRIRQELETARQAAAGEQQRANLTDAIQRLEEAHVSTIHGFCADLLRERPIEGGVDPLFEVMTEGGSRRLFADAFHGWLQERLEDPPEGVRRALRRSVWSADGRGDADGPITRLERAARELAEWRDFSGPWRRDPFDRDTALGRVVDRIREVATLTAAPASTRDPLFVDTRPIREFAHEIDTVLRFGRPEGDDWEARAIDLALSRDLKRVRRGRDRMYAAGIARDAVWDALQALLETLDDFQRAADADLAALLHEELEGAIERYEALKQRAGRLDFVDLLLRARNLLVEHPQVRTAFQSRFTHLFVDEFQDTDPLQAEVLVLLAADNPSERDWRQVVPIPGKLFLVGDPKQAIYRFRRADVETYQQVCDLLKTRGAHPVRLHTSFRATPNIQRTINAAFAPIMDGNRTTLQAEYVELSPERPDLPDQPSVVVLPVPAPYGQRRVAGFAIEASFPSAVGAFVEWLVKQSGWTVTERTTRDGLPMGVPVEPRHICVLFRRFVHYGKDVTRPYVDELEARGIPHLLVGGKSFHDREEVEAMRAALAAVEWPDDDVAVFATLRGPLFAIDDESLFLYRMRHHTLHPFRVADDPEWPPISAALNLLRRLHSRRNYRAIGDTITDLLTATRAHVGFVLRNAGEQALANVLHVAELARQYEAAGGISFRGFVESLSEEADDGQAAEAPILEEGADGVRLMTTHKAKGLEFPIVILADMTARLKSDRADRMIDRDRHACYLRLGRWTPTELAAAEPIEIARDEAEGIRVAYVAATRARDLLVIPAVGDVEWDGGWISPLNRAIYPAADRRAAAAAPGCPPFRRDSVAERPDNDPATAQTVCPGQYRLGSSSSEANLHTIVWWDPNVLIRDVPPAPGIRRGALIAKDAPDGVVNEGLEEYERWRTRLDQTIATASKPSIAIRTATEWAAAGDAIDTGVPTSLSGAVPAVLQATTLPVEQPGLFDEIASPEAVPSVEPRGDVEIVDVGGRETGTTDALRPTERAGGARFGELVHAVLASVPLDADGDQVSALAEVQGRILSAPGDEIVQSAEVVARVLAHDVLARARSAAGRGMCRREAPVTLTLADGTLVEGVVDLAFEERGEWTVVDYKTDREMAAAGEERYRRQVMLYAFAVSQATGRPARGVLVRVQP